MPVNPKKLACDIEWPGAGLRHLWSLEPDNLIWGGGGGSKLSHGSVAWPFHPAGLDEFGGGLRKQQELANTNKHKVIGNNRELWAISLNYGLE